MSYDTIKTDFCNLPPSQLKILNLTLNHLKTNSTKLAHYRLKIQKVIEFFYFQSLIQHPFNQAASTRCSTDSKEKLSTSSRSEHASVDMT